MNLIVSAGVTHNCQRRWNLVKTYNRGLYPIENEWFRFTHIDLLHVKMSCRLYTQYSIVLHCSHYWRGNFLQRFCYPRERLFVDRFIWLFIFLFSCVGLSSNAQVRFGRLCSCVPQFEMSFLQKTTRTMPDNRNLFDLWIKWYLGSCYASPIIWWRAANFPSGYLFEQPGIDVVLHNHLSFRNQRVRLAGFLFWNDPTLWSATSHISSLFKQDARVVAL